MIHHRRRFNVADIDTAATLAQILTRGTQCLCSGFRVAGYLFLNDSFSEDGAQEYAVFRVASDGQHEQIESITFGWCNYAQTLDYIERIVRGELAVRCTTGGPLTVQTHQEHRAQRCQLCA